MFRKYMKPIIAIGLAVVVLLSAVAVNAFTNNSGKTFLQFLGISNASNNISSSIEEFEFEKQGYKNAWDMLLAEDGFVYGVDYNYVGDNVNFPNSLGSNHLLNKSATYNSYLANADINNMKALRFNATSYWLLQDGQGIQFDDNGLAIGIDEEFLNNFRDLLNICRKTDMKLLPALVPHGVASNYNDGGPAGNPEQIYYKYFRYMWDDEALDAFIKNVINPVLDVIYEYQDVVIAVACVVENATDMVDDPEAGFYQSNRYGTTWENFANFVNQLHRAVKAKMPDMYTSIEEAGVNDPTTGTHEKLYRQNDDLEVDFISENYYNNNGNIEPHSVGLTTRPGYIGEMNGGGPATDLNAAEYWKSVKNNFHKSAKQGGWLGAFFFSWKAGGVDYQMITGNTTDYATYTPWAVNFRYTILDGIYEFRGVKRPAVEASAVMANTGGDTAYFIPGRGAVEFDLERSIDGGTTWQKVNSERITVDDNSTDNGFVKYKDTTLAKGMTFAYRVVSYDDEGNSVTGEPNNFEEFFVPENLLSASDAGFESNGTMGGWTHVNAGKISSEDKHSGEYSFLVDKSDADNTNANYGADYIDVTVKPNTMYKLSFWYNCVDFHQNSGASRPYVQLCTTDNINLQATWVTEATSDWKKVSINASVGNYDKIRIRIVTGDKNVDVFKCYFDDFDIQEVR